MPRLYRVNLLRVIDFNFIQVSVSCLNAKNIPNLRRIRGVSIQRMIARIEFPEIAGKSSEQFHEWPVIRLVARNKRLDENRRSVPAPQMQLARRETGDQMTRVGPGRGSSYERFKRPASMTPG